MEDILKFNKNSIKYMIHKKCKKGKGRFNYFGEVNESDGYGINYKKAYFASYIKYKHLLLLNSI